MLEEYKGIMARAIRTYNCAVNLRILKRKGGLEEELSRPNKLCTVMRVCLFVLSVAILEVVVTSRSITNAPSVNAKHDLEL